MGKKEEILIYLKTHIQIEEIRRESTIIRSERQFKIDIHNKKMEKEIEDKQKNKNGWKKRKQTCSADSDISSDEESFFLADCARIPSGGQISIVKEVIINLIEKSIK